MDTAPLVAVPPAPKAAAIGVRRLAVAHIGVAVAAFGVASAMAMMQALSRANLELPFRSASMYYMSVTGHGTLMALVFTTFFIMAFGYVVAERALGRAVPYRWIAWVSFWVAAAGTLATVAAIVAFKATVLYTFYPPLQAHPAFYIGLTLVVVGSWGWSLVMLLSLRAWRKNNAGRPIPLAMYGVVATVIVWLLATAGVAAEMLLLLIPWSLGLTKTVDPELARMLFWWFGHPLVYFWLLPAYVIWYTVLPRAAGGRLFSDPLGRLVFALFILLSTPVGFHHQFMDPGIATEWKMLHTFNTLWILYPSFVTAFTIIASLEVAGRARGGQGLFGWIRKLPWGDPLVSSVIFSMLLFAFGGWGGAINASFGMNAVVHNTSWIPGHFHTTVGSASALTFMGASVLAAAAPFGEAPRACADGEGSTVYLVRRHAALLDSDAHHRRHGHAPQSVRCLVWRPSDGALVEAVDRPLRDWRHAAVRQRAVLRAGDAVHVVWQRSRARPG